MNEIEILNSARIKLASILNSNVSTEKLAQDTGVPAGFSTEKSASASLARNIKDLLLPPALGVLGGGAAGALSQLMVDERDRNWGKGALYGAGLGGLGGAMFHPLTRLPGISPEYAFSLIGALGMGGGVMAANERAQKKGGSKDIYLPMMY